VIRTVKPQPGKFQTVSLCDHIPTSELFSYYYDYAIWAVWMRNYTSFLCNSNSFFSPPTSKLTCSTQLPIWHICDFSPRQNWQYNGWGMKPTTYWYLLLKNVELHFHSLKCLQGMVLKLSYEAANLHLAYVQMPILVSHTKKPQRKVFTEIRHNCK
jgi:hypothetical protein